MTETRMYYKQYMSTQSLPQVSPHTKLQANGREYANEEFCMGEILRYRKSHMASILRQTVNTNEIRIIGRYVYHLSIMH